MKYLKISISSNPPSNEMIYPIGYQNEIGPYAVDHLYYEDGIYLKLLLCIPDASYNAGMIRTGVEEVSDVDAKALSESKETRTETINDEAKLRRIELKAQLGMTLTKDEEDAIDPSKQGSIFGVSEILSDRIVKLKAKGL